MSTIKNSLPKPETGRLLEQYCPIIFGPQLMKDLGRAPSIFLQKLHYWLNTEGDHIGHYIDGKRWIYNSHHDWTKSLGIYCTKTIYRAIKKLEIIGIISSLKLNAKKGNHIKAYTINYNVLNTLFPWLRKENSDGGISNNKRNLQIIPQKKLSITNGQNVQIINETENTCITSISSGEEVSNKPVKQPPAKLSRKEKISKPELKESNLTEANRVIHQLIEVYGKYVSEKKVTLNKRLAKWLMAAFQKIGSCLKKWESFCKRIATSDWLMGRVTNRFKASLSWLLRFDIIDRILGGDFKCKEPYEEPPTTTQEDEEKLIYEIENSEISVEEQNVKKTLLKTFGFVLFKCWLNEVRINLEHGKVILLVKSLFYKDYIEELLGQKMRKLYPTVLIQIDDRKFS